MSQAALPLPVQVTVLGEAARILNLDDPIRMLRDFQKFIDTDELRRVAHEVWGTPAVPSPASATLDDTGDRLVDHFLRTVQDRWQGSAYDGFERYLTDVRAALHQEADSLPMIGAALVEVADGIELTWLEMIGAALTAAGLILSVEGLLSAGNIVVGLIGLLIALISGLVTLISLRAPRVALLARQETTLDRYVRNAPSPVDALPAIQGRATGWQPRTADPYT